MTWKGWLVADTAVLDAPPAPDVDEAFTAALAQDAAVAPPQQPAPPRHATSRDPDAPHGRDEDGTPLAPYGTGKNGRPRIKPAGPGRGGKADEPRTREALPGETTPAKPGTQPAGLAPHDFSAGLMEFGETAWFAGSIVAKIGPQLPFVGRLVPGRKLAATMAVLDAERPRLAAALNEAAQHDQRARKLAAKLASGELAWQMTVIFMVAPAITATAAVWQGDAALAERELPSLDVMAAQNDKNLNAMFARITAQMEAAQAQAAESLNGQAQPQEAAA